MELTKKEAIELLSERYMTMSMCADKDYCAKQNAAIDMAIAALSAQDFTTEGGTVMRDVIFRGKRVDNGEWIEGDLVHANNRILILAHGCAFEIVAETVGQYTGLTDKNGKHIFEGDVIVCKQYIDGNSVDASIEFGFVEMKYGAFGLHRRQGFYRPFKDWLEDYELEIIGNIHDSPELLKGE